MIHTLLWRMNISMYAWYYGRFGVCLPVWRHIRYVRMYLSKNDADTNSPASIQAWLIGRIVMISQFSGMVCLASRVHTSQINLCNQHLRRGAQVEGVRCAWSIMFVSAFSVMSIPFFGIPRILASVMPLVAYSPFKTWLNLTLRI